MSLKRQAAIIWAATFTVLGLLFVVSKCNAQQYNVYQAQGKEYRGTEDTGGHIIIQDSVVIFRPQERPEFRFKIKEKVGHTLIFKTKGSWSQMEMNVYDYDVNGETIKLGMFMLSRRYGREAEEVTIYWVKKQ